MPRSHRWTAVPLLGVLAVACGAAGPTERPTPAAKAVAPTPRPTPALRMRAHFEEVRQIELALLFGKLDTARFHADLLARKIGETGFAPAKVAGVVRLAGELARTDRLEAALPLAAELAGECAACHQASGAKVALPLVAEPGEDGSIEARMARHQWAADRMWEGLVASSDAPWREGLAVLAGEPLLPDAMTDDRAYYAKLDQIGNELALRARRASAAPSGRGRTEAFGEVLELCSACHVLVRR